MIAFTSYFAKEFAGPDGGDGLFRLLSIIFDQVPSNPDYDLLETNLFTLCSNLGGNGGHVIFRANRDVKSLTHVRRTYQGEHGEAGQSCSMTGKCGEHLFVDVPVGTLVKSPPVFSDADPFNLKDVTVVTATKTLADLDEHGSMFLAGKGGMGGM